jgi:glucose/arabinose dehydrogenase
MKWQLLLLAFIGAESAWALPPVNLEHVAAFQSPLYVSHAGDGRIFIVERAGRILVCATPVCTSPTTFLDISTLVDTSDDGGLFTVAFHPDYASNGYFFVSYTEDGGGGPSTGSVISRYEVSAGDPNVANAGSEARLIEVAQPNVGHTNAQLTFGPNDGLLYVGFGDGGGQNGPQCRAQHDADTLGSDAFFGKILRLDVDQNVGQSPYYGIPTGNPFESAIDGIQDEIWALGFRNPWRFSFDGSNGDLWIGDVGQSTREEVNLQPASSIGGENYGWKVMEGTSCHDPDPVDLDCPASTPSCFDSSYTPPLFEYDNHGFGSDACSVTGGFVYRGTAIAGLQGAYVFGDYCGGFVWALKETAPSVWTRSELAILSIGLTSFGEDAAGELYVTHNDDVYRVVPEPGISLSLATGLAWLTMLNRHRRRRARSRVGAGTSTRTTTPSSQ